MQASFPRLSEPGWIGNVRLKNRVLKAPQHTGLANPDGSITDRLLRYYKEVASGGVGMVIVEYAWVDDDASRASPCQLGIARHRSHARAFATRSDDPGERSEGRHPDIARGSAEVHARKTESSVDRCLGRSSTRPAVRPRSLDLRRDTSDRQVLRPSGQARPDRGFRHGRDTRLPRLSHLEFPLPENQQADGLVRRLAGEPHAFLAGSDRGDQMPGRVRLPRLCEGERHRLRARRHDDRRDHRDSASASRRWASLPSTCREGTTTRPSTKSARWGCRWRTTYGPRRPSRRS